MQCDICGKETSVFLTEMEGARIYVCRACNPKGEGRIARTPRTFTPRPNFTPRTAPRLPKDYQDPFDLTNYELVEDYTKKIVALREEKKLTIEDFAKSVYIPVSYMQKVEQGKLKPSSRLLLKIYEKYGLLLIDKLPDMDKPIFRKHIVKKDFSERKNNFKRDFKNENNFERREKFEGSKVIYKPEESKEKELVTEEYNNKKKIVL
jgi:uncharacterized protein (TIGR00270 family)